MNRIEIQELLDKEDYKSLYIDSFTNFLGEDNNNNYSTYFKLKPSIIYDYLASDKFKDYLDDHNSSNINIKRSFTFILITLNKTYQITKDDIYFIIEKINSNYYLNNRLRSFILEIFGNNILLDRKFIELCFKHNKSFLVNIKNVEVDSSYFSKLSVEDKLFLLISIATNRYAYYLNYYFDNKNKLFENVDINDIRQVFEKTDIVYNYFNFNVGYEFGHLPINEFISLINIICVRTNLEFMDYFKINNIDINTMDKSYFDKMHTKILSKISAYTDYKTLEFLLDDFPEILSTTMIVKNKNITLSEIETLIKKYNLKIQNVRQSYDNYRVIKDDDLIKYPWIIDPQMLNSKSFVYYKKPALQALNKYWGKKQRYDESTATNFIVIFRSLIEVENKLSEEYFKYYLSLPEFQEKDDKLKSDCISIFISFNKSKKYEQITKFINKYKGI